MVSLRSLILAAYALYSSFASSLPSSFVQNRDEPVHPDKDAFYVPPPGYEKNAPGDILRHRKTPFPIAAFSLVPINLAGVYQILYRSTDSFGNPTATVTTVLLPYNANFTKLVSYQVVEDAAYMNCAPSYALQLNSDPGGFFGTIITQSEFLLITAALENGWVVTIPDHEGPNAVFLANIYAGYATLDGIRASLASTAFTGISSNATVVLWGTSGGAMASGFAAELHASYAPELEIAGVALGGTVPNVTNAMHSLNEAFDAGIIVAGVLGLSHEYSELADIINSTLIEDKREKFMQAEKQCGLANFFSFTYENIFDYFRDERNKTIFINPVVTDILDKISMGKTTPKAPLLIYKSINDEISPIADTDAIVDTYCANGGLVDYKKDVLSFHTIFAVMGAPTALMWLNDRLNGVPRTQNCSTSISLITLLEPRALWVMSKAVIDNLLNFLGRRVGPEGSFTI